MSNYSADRPLDPRIKRTREMLRSALYTLLESKSFDKISISDICREAGIARVTFYQHHESKESLLLAEVADFFASMYQAFDKDVLDRFFETGEIAPLLAVQQNDLADPNRVRLVRIALQHAGSAVRELTTASFLETYSQHETELGEQEVLVLATFYVGGMLMLLEQFLNGRLAISPVAFQAVPLTLLRMLRHHAVQSGILQDLL